MRERDFVGTFVASGFIPRPSRVRASNYQQRGVPPSLAELWGGTKSGRSASCGTVRKRAALFFSQTAQDSAKEFPVGGLRLKSPYRNFL